MGSMAKEPVMDNVAIVTSIKPPCKKPCAECPFLRTSVRGWLGPWKPMELILSLSISSFPCHLTITDPPTEDLRSCAGAAIFLNNKFEISRNPFNREAQLALKTIDQETKDSVFKRTDEFVNYHGSFGDGSDA